MFGPVGILGTLHAEGYTSRRAAGLDASSASQQAGVTDCGGHLHMRAACLSLCTTKTLGPVIRPVLDLVGLLQAVGLPSQARWASHAGCWMPAGFLRPPCPSAPLSQAGSDWVPWTWDARPFWRQSLAYGSKERSKPCNAELPVTLSQL